MKTIVVEDSKRARQGLLRKLEAYPQLNIVGDAQNVEQALALISKQQPELIFLDIHMPQEDGFALLKQLDYTPKVIFTTAYSEHALHSFDYNTVDYLLKPISQVRLNQAIEKLTLVDSQPESQSEIEPSLDKSSQIFIRDGDDCHLVELKNIMCIESCKNYVQVYFDDKKAFVKKSLAQIEARLPSEYFFKANRQFIINLTFVESIEESIADGYDVVLKNKMSVNVSRRNAVQLKQFYAL